MKYFPLVILSSFLIRTLIFGASIGDAVALLGLCALYAFTHFLENKKEIPVNEQLKKELEQSKKDIQEIKTSLGAFKLANQLRGVK